MEGRERSRPDDTRVSAGRAAGPRFNGGAGTFPPGRAQLIAATTPATSLQWRGGNVPARTRDVPARPHCTTRLQWRGGNVPARTTSLHTSPPHHPPASMEGRERSRPDFRLPRGFQRSVRASMEGRERSRPDPARTRHHHHHQQRFNGGAGTFPPGLDTERGRVQGSALLQWRGGNVPARTATPEKIPRRTSRLQWRGGNVPARTSLNGSRFRTRPKLQWRGGNVPARTHLRDRRRTRSTAASMEGRERSRPDPLPTWPAPPKCFCFNGGAGTFPPGPANLVSLCDERSGASMEGRERSRPDSQVTSAEQTPEPSFNGGAGTFPPGRNSDQTTRRSRAMLQWRGGNVPARTRPNRQQNRRYV